MNTMIADALRLTATPMEAIMRLLGVFPDMPQQQLGEKLRGLREAGGVSAVDLATAMGVKKSILSHYEAGRRKMPEGFAERYITQVQTIVRDRARAVGVL